MKFIVFRKWDSIDSVLHCQIMPKCRCKPILVGLESVIKFIFFERKGETESKFIVYSKNQS